MKIDTLIRLIAIVPRKRGEALSTADIVDRYYKRYSNEVDGSIKPESKLRRIELYMDELCENGLAERLVDDDKGKKSPARFHLRESHILSYFLHSKAALNLLWFRGVSRQFDDLAGASEMERLALNARLSERERVLRDRVRIVPDGVGREFATIGAPIMLAVVKAMETGYMLEMVTETRTGVREELEVTVLGLVAKDGTAYMIAVRGFDDRPRHFPLHRVKRAEVIRARAFTRPDFVIDDYIRAQHQLAHVLDGEPGPIELDLLVAKEALFHFRERPFLTVVGRQQISKEPVHGKWYSVKATVPDTIMLAPFLWSHAGWIQVLGPASVRKRVAEGVRAAAAHYKGD